MSHINDQYLVNLLIEQTIKKYAFDQQVKIEFLHDHETAATKQERREYMKFLAGRLTQINLLLDRWADTVELNLDQIMNS